MRGKNEKKLKQKTDEYEESVQIQSVKAVLCTAGFASSIRETDRINVHAASAVEKNDVLCRPRALSLALLLLDVFVVV